MKSRPKAKVAVLYENTDLGRDMLTGLTRAIAGKGPRIVGKQSYEFTGADVSSQIGLLKASGADTLMLFATPKFFLNAITATHKLGWKPQVYIASVSIEPTIMGYRALQRAGADEGCALDRVREEPERSRSGRRTRRSRSTARS